MNIESNTPKVSFEEEEYTVSAQVKKRPSIISSVIAISGGYIKDEKQASYVLLAIIAILFLFSLFLVFNSGSKSPQNTFTPPADALPGEVVPPAI